MSDLNTIRRRLSQLAVLYLLLAIVSAALGYYPLTMLDARPGYTVLVLPSGEEVELPMFFDLAVLGALLLWFLFGIAHTLVALPISFCLTSKIGYGTCRRLTLALLVLPPVGTLLGLFTKRFLDQERVREVFD